MNWTHQFRSLSGSQTKQTGKDNHRSAKILHRGELRACCLRVGWLLQVQNLLLSTRQGCHQRLRGTNISVKTSATIQGFSEFLAEQGIFKIETAARSGHK